MENTETPISAGLTQEAFTITATHTYGIKLKDRLKLLFKKGITVKTQIVVKENPTVLNNSSTIFITK